MKELLQKGKALAWPKNFHIKKAQVIGYRHECLYKLSAIFTQALLMETSNQNGLWHRRLTHLHYKALSYMGKMVKGIPHLNR